MAEDSADHDNEELIAGLEHGDLKPRFYEGGFKTWECSVDLAKLVTGDSSIIDSLNDSQTDVHIIEVCPLFIVTIMLTLDANGKLAWSGDGSAVIGTVCLHTRAARV